MPENKARKRRRTEPAKSPKGVTLSENMNTSMLTNEELSSVQQELNEALDRYRNLYDFAPVAYLTLDKKFNILAANLTASEMLGLSRIRLLKKNFADFIHSDYADKFCIYLVAAFEANAKRNFEIEMKRADGTPFVVALTASAVPDEEGAFRYVRIALIDITPRKKAEQALSRERDILETIMEKTDTMLAYFDRDFNFVRVNSAYAAGSGHTPQMLIGKNNFKLFPNDENEELFRQVRDTGEAVTFHDKHFEFKCQPWRGITYWDWTLTPVKNASGYMEGLVLSLKDTTERKLKERQLEFQANVLEQVNDVVIAMDNERRVTYCNKMAEQLYGFKAEEATGQKLDDLFQRRWLKPEDEEEWKRSMEARGSWKGELVHIKKDGQEIFVESSRNFFRDNSGNPVGHLAVIRDITQRKLAERNARENQELVQRLFESGVIGIDVANIEGKVVEANDTFLKIVGYSREDLLEGKISWLGMTPPEYTDPDKVALQELFTSGSCTPFEKEYIRKDGTRVPILIGAVLKDLSSKNPSWIGFILDMSGLREAEQALRESEAKYRTLIESAPDGVISLDTNGCITGCNKTLSNMMGYSNEEIRGRDISEYLSSVSEGKINDYYEQLLQGKEFESEFQAICRDGRIVPLWAKGIGIFDSHGNLKQVIVYVRDITERKKADDIKDEFIGLVSHELRTPLTIIIGAINTVLSEFKNLSPDEIESLLTDASLEAESLAHIVSNLLELSRAQAQRLSLFVEPVRIDLIAKSVVEKVSRQSASHRFSMKFPPQLPMVNGDSLRLELILHNIVENAVKYSPDHSEVRVFARVRKGEMVVGVADQGIGVSAHEQSQIFRPFQRMANKESGGVGLGLIVCKRLIEAHNGRIWVESEPGKGSTFYISIPVLPELES